MQANPAEVGALTARVFQEPQSLEAQIIAAAKDYDLDPSLALKIAACESSLRQFNKHGKPLRGIKNPADVGVFQINESYHKADSQKLGFDLESTDGNIDYAMTIMARDGVRHWHWSRKCWDESAA